MTNLLREIYAHWSSLALESEPTYDAVALSFEAILRNHFHLDSVRERPKSALNLRDLPDEPKYRLWRQLIPDNLLREQASAALETLTRQPGQTTGYRLAMRSRIVEIRGRERSQSIKSTTQELAILNPQGLLLGVEDVGYGISTVLPIVTAINYRKACMISIEQPELHIHPRLQTEIGELLLQSSRRNRNTLLVETHSEHLILRILRRIRETSRGKLPDGIAAVRPDEVTVIYVEPCEDGSLIREIKIDEQGRIRSEWPKGFFEERLEELF